MKTLVTRLSASVLTAALAILFAMAMPAEAHVGPNDKIIVSGASGQLGTLAVEELLARGVPAKQLILVSRTPEKLEKYAAMGASTRFGDFSKPESLPAAYAGGTRMLLISIGGGAGPRPEAHKRAIDAAKAAGVKHIAYTSWVAISNGDTSGLGTDHAATEEILKQSGVTWTFLRNSIYMENTLQQAMKMLAEGRATVPANEIRIGYVTRRDCAAAAAAVLTTHGHENKAYDITGSELIGVREIADAVQAVTGKTIEISTADPSAPPPRGFVTPAVAIASDHVAQLLRRPPTSLKEFFTANKDKLLSAGT
ncbi:MAG TPA: NAD(P)H-binding protein [Steroidobacteraceae bacterium]